MVVVYAERHVPRPSARIAADLAHVHAAVGRVLVAADAQLDAGVQDHELEEVELHQGAGDELSQGGRAGEAVHAALAPRVDLDRCVREEEVGELGPGASGHDVGVGVLETPDRDVVVGLGHRTTMP